MRKIIPLLTLLVTISCSNQRLQLKKAHVQDLSHLTIKANIDEAGILNIVFRNNSDNSIRVFKPCNVNTSISVINNGVELPQNFKYKANPKCTSLVSISANQEISFKWETPFLDLYDLEDGKDYDIYIMYYSNYKAMIDNKGIKSEIYYYKLNQQK